MGDARELLKKSGYSNKAIECAGSLVAGSALTEMIK